MLLVSEASTPPVCKIIEFGQFKYEQQKKDKQSKKSSKNQVIKEIKMRPKISEHDFQIKANRGIDFLKKGYKVKLTISFRGREVVHPEIGRSLVAKYIESISEYGTANNEVASSKRSIVVNINAK